MNAHHSILMIQASCNTAGMREFKQMARGTQVNEVSTEIKGMVHLHTEDDIYNIKKADAGETWHNFVIKKKKRFTNDTKPSFYSINNVW